MIVGNYDGEARSVVDGFLRPSPRSLRLGKRARSVVDFQVSGCHRNAFLSEAPAAAHSGIRGLSAGLVSMEMKPVECETKET